MINWKYAIAGFCVPVNIIFIIFGIVINDAFMVTLGVMSIILVMLPVVRDYYAQKEDEEEKTDD